MVDITSIAIDHDLLQRVGLSLPNCPASFLLALPTIVIESRTKENAVRQLVHVLEIFRN
jgi:hypothetical protein